MEKVIDHAWKENVGFLFGRCNETSSVSVIVPSSIILFQLSHRSHLGLQTRTSPFQQVLKGEFVILLLLVFPIFPPQVLSLHFDVGRRHGTWQQATDQASQSI